MGKQYVLTFYQASAQFTNETGATTEQFQVTFGTGAANTQTSTLMNTPSQGSIGWNLQTMVFKATSATQTLSFLAEGGPAGLPPFALLDDKRYLGSDTRARSVRHGWCRVTGYLDHRQAREQTPAGS